MIGCIAHQFCACDPLLAEGGLLPLNSRTPIQINNLGPHGLVAGWKTPHDRRARSDSVAGLGRPGPCRRRFCQQLNPLFCSALWSIPRIKVTIRRGAL